NPPINKSQQRSQNTSDYVVNCLDCGQEYETDKNKKPHSNCWYCQSKNIQEPAHGSTTKSPSLVVASNN
ncbi:13082_t:CDS:2, partial [Racocetra persica]